MKISLQSAGRCMVLILFPALYIHRAALKMHQNLAAKSALKCQIDFLAISTGYFMNIPQCTRKLL